MSSLKECLLARAHAHKTGAPEPAPVPEPVPVVADEPQPAGFSFSQFDPVSHTEELDRVLSLPRRPRYDAADPSLPALVAELTERYRRPAGTMTLLPVQAFALREVEQHGGLLGLLAVGSGKTLLSLLAPVALGSRKAVLMVPATLRDKLFDLEYPALSQHWRVPNLDPRVAATHFPDVDCTLYVVAYETLSSPKNGDVLERLAPDTIVLDEAHSVAGASARSKRMRRFFRGHPHTRFVNLSGSMAKVFRNLIFPAHSALKSLAPVPLDFHDQEAWGHALDPINQRREPGALLQLCTGGEVDVREGYSRRLVETPGVVATSDAPVLKEGGEEVSLNIHGRWPELPPVVDTALQDLRTNARTPDGFEFDSVLEQSRYARQIACGFYYVRTWPENEPMGLRIRWVTARNAYFKAVRDYLAHSSRTGMDSPGLLWEAALAGRWRCPEWKPWADVRDLCHPDKEDVWLSEFLVEDAVRWGEENVGIIWTSHTAFGEKIARGLGAPYYGEGSESARAIAIETGRRTIVASAHAHYKGRNLQAFHRNLVTTPSTSGERWEQLLGRTHRFGQLTDSVEITVYTHTPELNQALLSALENARFQQQITSGRQKLLSATFTFTPTPKSRR